MSDLLKRRCSACTADTPRVERKEAERLLTELPGFALFADATGIGKTFKFRDFPETIVFVNAVAWIAHREDHHPDLEVGYDRCTVKYTTHAVGGLSENDFICAAKVNALL
jgi:4a-hydroxytetrahydrobiopterin dehydratase